MPKTLTGEKADSLVNGFRKLYFYLCKNETGFSLSHNTKLVS